MTSHYLLCALYLVSVVSLGSLTSSLPLAGLFCVIALVLFAVERFFNYHAFPFWEGLFAFAFSFLPAVVCFIITQNEFTWFFLFIPFLSIFTGTIVAFVRRKNLEEIIFDHITIHAITLVGSLSIMSLLILIALPYQSTVLMFLCIVVAPTLFWYKFVSRIFYTSILNIPLTVSKFIRSFFESCVYVLLIVFFLSAIYAGVLSIALAQLQENPLAAPHDVLERGHAAIEQLQLITGRLEVIESIKQELSITEYESPSQENYIAYLLQDEWIIDVENNYQYMVVPYLNVLALKYSLDHFSKGIQDVKNYSGTYPGYYISLISLPTLSLEEAHANAMIQKPLLSKDVDDLVILPSLLTIEQDTPLDRVTVTALKKLRVGAALYDLQARVQKDTHVPPIMETIYEQRTVEESSDSKLIRKHLLYTFLMKEN